MKSSFFQMGFATNSFRPLQRQVPLRIANRRGLGQDEIITSYDQTPLEPAPTYSYPDETSYSPPSYYPTGPGEAPTREMTTPIVPANPPPPGLPPAPVIPAKQPAGTSDTDWAKLLAAGITAGAAGYGAYSKEEIARIDKQAAELKARNPGMSALLPSMGISSNMLFIGGAVLVTGIIAVIALK